MLTDLLKHAKDIEKSLFETPSLQQYAFYYIFNRDKLNTLSVDELSGDEEILSAKGYKSISPIEDELKIIKRQPLKKGIHYTSDCIKLVGIHLASQESIEDKIDDKFNNGSLKEKYFISKALPSYKKKLSDFLRESTDTDEYHKVIDFVINEITSDDTEDSIFSIIRKDADAIDLLLINDYIMARGLDRTKYLNISAKTLIIQILNNFSNAIKKITVHRYNSRAGIEIKDEYDVQDVLHTMLIGIFPDLKPEEQVQRTGAKNTRVDFALDSEGILIEAKMISDNYKDEKEFIEQLKKDIESYFVYPNLKDVIFFVYAPDSSKIKNVNNFYSLNGQRSNTGKSFEVTVIVNP
ncbi:hypothetical protein [Cytophaga hutchinsonii]|uniref:Uncharacterized protein n=1 Tax=Cytophaga hutchinsonii (strain ATCC 33406 / DSM 1761 / CIP 103989 / NBRC 15051 / NCIMB 9469 / D465) TaxID=269798 RepID=A0A6N4SVC5_CYTH3|nr:hypothetical protein [Cytophaga hutchinsonii]ABG60198.1 hypothetical protein CHU_2956 [Cytophaga hutchinsonii ATCC 33406]SFX22145.1 hypothetical protein SAMN04487930_102105 [Cytophaga hutchinsonii ATCC 33406]